MRKHLLRPALFAISLALFLIIVCIPLGTSLKESYFLVNQNLVAVLKQPAVSEETKDIAGVYYYVTDMNKNVRNVVKDGEVVSWTDYDPFGKESPFISIERELGQFKFKSGRLDNQIGKYIGDGNAYDPLIARNLQPKASNDYFMPQTLNPYVAFANNPFREIKGSALIVDLSIPEAPDALKAKATANPIIDISVPPIAPQALPRMIPLEPSALPQPEVDFPPLDVPPLHPPVKMPSTPPPPTSISYTIDPFIKARGPTLSQGFVKVLGAYGDTGYRSPNIVFDQKVDWTLRTLSDGRTVSVLNIQPGEVLTGKVKVPPNTYFQKVVTITKSYASTPGHVPVYSIKEEWVSVEWVRFIYVQDGAVVHDPDTVDLAEIIDTVFGTTFANMEKYP